MKNFIFITTYLSLTLGNSILFAISILLGLKFLTYFTLLIATLFIFTGMTGFIKEMSGKMALKENYSTMVQENLIPIYMRPIVGLSSSFIFIYFGYEIFAFLIMLSSFGEVVLHQRVISILRSNA